MLCVVLACFVAFSIHHSVAWLADCRRFQTTLYWSLVGDRDSEMAIDMLYRTGSRMLHIQTIVIGGRKDICFQENMEKLAFRVLREVY